ncbi:exodeoxyribonuclease V subunit gamma [Shewanella intestini]|uniref:RecBCD enzyme subunit RecC n=1 Tax=Shewanella intestini TaxID=2017544 RepID=A0ABS5I788_9GAMM|nr:MULTISPECIES: exodeoxyribonuclease V subunit gamma [Shewanella]MBR9729235.1 exodeoxyribonuclease V subunit gamma [Shewanella intestini]MRG35380.1 exodeoxyribonuclease V subunit gamma [Shewanella sp. XMDDZSB0408]
MLKLIQSNQMEVLSAHLANFIATPLPNTPLLSNESILVQSPGMSTWLRLEIAKHNHIAAGLTFPLPSSFTWQLCHLLLPDVPKENAFTKAAMTWKLLDLLPSLLNDTDYAPLSQYLDLPAEITDEALANIDGVKLYQLCGRIADIFDQYLVFRPDWIQCWEQQQPLTELAPNLTLDANQQWQPKLWRALIDYNQHQLNASVYHRANLHADLIQALNNPDSDISELPKRLFVFGISSMPPQTLDVLYHLAKRIDVIILALSPCQHYWGDIVDPKVRARMSLQYANKKQLQQDWEACLEVGNPLLANNGKMGRELLDLMLSLPEDHTDFGDDCYIEPQPNNLLHGVQYDILQMETLGQALGPDADIYHQVQLRRPLQANDNSITLRSCHSPLREVETLHDHILGLLAQDETLSPKDIVIMLPDVAAYAPYIDAVFSTANSQPFSAQHPNNATSQNTGNRYIPYAIADRGAAQESPLINSFLSLLNINQSRFGLTEIIGILEVPAILRRFGLDDEDLQLIRRWLDSANVRWGRDANSRSELGLHSFSQNSWAFGIRRLILGYAMNDDADIYHDTLLVAGVEGQSAQALGKLLNFLEKIDHYHNAFLQPQKTRKLLSLLTLLLEDFYEAIDDEQQQLQTIREALSSLDTELFEAGHPLDNEDNTNLSLTLNALTAHRQLDIEILRQWFTQRLTESRVGQRYLAGSINFCTLMPMRSIPFKVVCLLGMNDGVYPRVQHPVGFDLMAHFGPIKGDRSRRLDDRYLFLEALLSAREQLYISFIGHSERDNTERLPSMLVSELIEFVQMSYLPLSQVSKLEQCTNTDILGYIEQLDNAVYQQLIIAQPLQPFDKRLYTPSGDHNSKQSFNPQWCPPSNNTLQEQAFLAANQRIVVDEHHTDTLALNGQTEIELSALMRFYRHPAQYFFNRTLHVDLALQVEADDNDEPFELDGLGRYLILSQLIDSALLDLKGHIEPQLLASLKASGELPMAPFDDLLLEKFTKDVAPLVNRVQYLREEQPLETVNVELQCQVDIGITDEHMTNLTVFGRIDNVSPKGLVNYRPGRAHGRDLIQMYLRHLCLNAMGVNKHSYLIDINDFHSFAPLTTPQALAQLSRFIRVFVDGQSRAICLPPRTSFVYAQTEGEHPEKLQQAKAQWSSSQSVYVEGQDPHNRRLFAFPDSFSQTQFGGLVEHLLAPMISLYQHAPLAQLDAFVTETAIEQLANVINQQTSNKANKPANKNSPIKTNQHSHVTHIDDVKKATGPEGVA